MTYMGHHDTGTEDTPFQTYGNMHTGGEISCELVIRYSAAQRVRIFTRFSRLSIEQSLQTFRSWSIRREAWPINSPFSVVLLIKCCFARTTIDSPYLLLSVTVEREAGMTDHTSWRGNSPSSFASCEWSISLTLWLRWQMRETSCAVAGTHWCSGTLFISSDITSCT